MTSLFNASRSGESGHGTDLELDRQVLAIANSATTRVFAENGFPSHLSERRYIYDYGFEGVRDAEWVVLDYESTNYNITAFRAQVASVEAAGYNEVAGGYGLALLRKR